jgi:hypothetical protein
MNKQAKIFSTAIELLEAGNLKTKFKGFTGGSVVESVIDNLATDSIHILSGLCDPQSSVELTNELIIELQVLAQKHANEISKMIHGEDGDSEY